jgi:hypothetical protein
MAKQLSRVAETLKRLVPYINTSNYTEFLEYIVFGAADAEEILENLTRSPGDREDTSRIDAVSKFASDLKAHRGRTQLAERISIDQRPKFKSDAFDAFPPTDPLRNIEQILQEHRGPARRPGTASERADEDDLEAAFVMELLGKVPEAVSRAAQLDQMNLERVPDKELRRYFEEAHHCYLYGLDVACAVLCRAILDSALQRICDPSRNLKREVQPYEYFDKLLDEAERGGLLADDRPACARKVRHAGNDAIHEFPRFEHLWEHKLGEILDDTRKVLLDLYSS